MLFFTKLKHLFKNQLFDFSADTAIVVIDNNHSLKIQVQLKNGAANATNIPIYSHPL